MIAGVGPHLMGVLGGGVAIADVLAHGPVGAGIDRVPLSAVGTGVAVVGGQFRCADHGALQQRLIHSQGTEAVLGPQLVHPIQNLKGPVIEPGLAGGAGGGQDAQQQKGFQQQGQESFFHHLTLRRFSFNFTILHHKSAACQALLGKKRYKTGGFVCSVCSGAVFCFQRMEHVI